MFQKNVRGLHVRRKKKESIVIQTPDGHKVMVCLLGAGRFLIVADKSAQVSRIPADMTKSCVTGGPIPSYNPKTKSYEIGDKVIPVEDVTHKKPKC